MTPRRKPGRPATGRRAKPWHVSATDADMAEIDRRATAAGLTRSAYMVRAALRPEVSVVVEPDDGDNGSTYHNVALLGVGRLTLLSAMPSLAARMAADLRAVLGLPEVTP